MRVLKKSIIHRKIANLCTVNLVSHKRQSDSGVLIKQEEIIYPLMTLKVSTSLILKLLKEFNVNVNVDLNFTTELPTSTIFQDWLVPDSISKCRSTTQSGLSISGAMNALNRFEKQNRFKRLIKHDVEDIEDNDEICENDWDDDWINDLTDSGDNELFE